MLNRLIPNSRIASMVLICASGCSSTALDCTFCRSRYPASKKSTADSPIARGLCHGRDPPFGNFSAPSSMITNRQNTKLAGVYRDLDQGDKWSPQHQVKNSHGGEIDHQVKGCIYRAAAYQQSKNTNNGGQPHA